MTVRSTTKLQMLCGTVALSAVMVLASCATIQQSVGKWFGAATATPTPTAQVPPGGALAPRVYYAGVEGLKMYSEPSASSKVAGVLSLHEKVIRTRLERGYAYVESAKSGVKGWVNNAQLLWRLPTAGSPAPGETPSEEPVAPGEEPEAPEAPQTPEATAPPTEPPPTPTPVPAATANPTATPRGLGPSIFNPY